MFNQDECLALLFEIASVGIVNKQFTHAPAIFTTLMEALPQVEAPLVGAATFQLLKGDFKSAAGLLEERRKFLVAPSIAFEATFAQAMFLCGRIGEAERLLSGVLQGKDGSENGVTFAKSVLKEIQGNSYINQSDSVLGRTF